MVRREFNHQVPIITVRHFTAGYDGHVLLRDLSFDIYPGEVFVILGGSGCGKSTLLNLIAGFETPSSGTLSSAGRPVTAPGPDRGVVFQEHTLFEWMTVANNVSFGLTCNADSRARFPNAAERTQAC